MLAGSVNSGHRDVRPVGQLSPPDGEGEHPPEGGELAVDRARLEAVSRLISSYIRI